MGRGALAVGVVALVLGACSAIVGVDDVRLKNDLSTSQDDAGGNPDPDPVVVTPPDDSGNGDTSTGTTECNGREDCERLVFVTKATFTGKLGGLTGADQKCFEAAKAIPGYAGRAFRAWLSDSTADAKARLPHGTKPYKRTDKTVFATSFTDLTDATTNLPLSLDETGTALSGSIFATSVWTSSDATGKYNGSSCNDWTTDSVSLLGNFGDSQATDVNWTEEVGEPIAQSTCNATKHLYCIEY